LVVSSFGHISDCPAKPLAEQAEKLGSVAFGQPQAAALVVKDVAGGVSLPRSFGTVIEVVDNRFDLGPQVGAKRGARAEALFELTFKIADAFSHGAVAGRVAGRTVVPVSCRMPVTVLSAVMADPNPLRRRRQQFLAELFTPRFIILQDLEGADVCKGMSANHAGEAPELFQGCGCYSGCCSRNILQFHDNYAGKPLHAARGSSLVRQPAAPLQSGGGGPGVSGSAAVRAQGH
jgi:hypothetical protein